MGLEGESADLRRLLAVGLGGQRHELDVGRLGHLGLRDLHLDLVRIAADIVAPEVAHGVAAGVGGGDQRFADVAGGHAAQAGPLAVERDLDGRVVERLLDLHVAERLDPVELLAELVHVGAGVGHVAPADDHLDRRGGTQAHRLGDQVARLEGEDQVGDALVGLRRASGPGQAAPGGTSRRPSPARALRSFSWSSKMSTPLPSRRPMRSRLSSGPRLQR